LISWTLRHEAARPLAEHLLRCYPPRDKAAAAATLLAAVKTQRIETVRLALDHIAVRREERMMSVHVRYRLTNDLLAVLGYHNTKNKSQSSSSS
jgi:hypothetical protein